MTSASPAGVVNTNPQENCAFDRFTHQQCEPSPQTKRQRQIVALVKHSTELLDFEPDDDLIQWQEDIFDHIGDSSHENPKSLVDKIKISGPPELQRGLRELCLEYSDIFSEYVRSEPAHVPPMELTVDPTIWEVSRNRAPPRPQSKNKTEEIKKQVDKLLELGVIGTSTASEHSQVHLVPKPTPGEWRFCIDFVNLNAATTGQEGWPLPNVSQMLQRIGEKRAKFYGVMDLTAGYHQLPLATTSMLFTAFITFMGLYHWFRLAMGLRGAAPYFQRTLATIVLAGLMYAICELYIDDLLVFAQTIPVFLENLRCVFMALRLYNIALNPKKCRFGILRSNA